jgi:hypothetical protein
MNHSDVLEFQLSTNQTKKFIFNATTAINYIEKIRSRKSSFQKTFSPAVHSIFYGEPRHKRMPFPSELDKKICFQKFFKKPFIATKIQQPN